MRHQTSFYFEDKDARMAQGFSDALSRERRMDRDEKCAGIIYLWVSFERSLSPTARTMGRRLISNSGTCFRREDKALRVNNWIQTMTRKVVRSPSETVAPLNPNSAYLYRDEEADTGPSSTTFFSLVRRRHKNIDSSARVVYGWRGRAHKAVKIYRSL